MHRPRIIYADDLRQVESAGEVQRLNRLPIRDLQRADNVRRNTLAFFGFARRLRMAHVQRTANIRRNVAIVALVLLNLAIICAYVAALRHY